MNRVRGYLKGWNFMRFLRFALGTGVVVQGILTQEWIFVGVGGMFSLMALLNLSACGAPGSACRNAMNNSNKKENEKITYEEVL